MLKSKLKWRDLASVRLSTKHSAQNLFILPEYHVKRHSHDSEFWGILGNRLSEHLRQLRQSIVQSCFGLSPASQHFNNVSDLTLNPLSLTWRKLKLMLADLALNSLYQQIRISNPKFNHSDTVSRALTTSKIHDIKTKKKLCPTMSDVPAFIHDYADSAAFTLAEPYLDSLPPIDTTNAPTATADQCSASDELSRVFAHLNIASQNPSTQSAAPNPPFPLENSTEALRHDKFNANHVLNYGLQWVEEEEEDGPATASPEQNDRLTRWLVREVGPLFVIKLTKMEILRVLTAEALAWFRDERTRELQDLLRGEVDGESVEMPERAAKRQRWCEAGALVQRNMDDLWELLEGIEELAV